MTAIGETFAGIVTDGSLILALLVAALVGLISFASPCCLPLVPGYIGYITGLAGAEAAAAATKEPAGPAPASETSGRALAVRAPQVATAGRRRVLLGAFLFVCGFSAVFVAFGALFGGLGRLLLEWAPVLTRVAGVITIGMGIAFLGGFSWLQRERRIHHRPTGGLAGAPVLGVVFGLGWTPCLGPTLAAVNTLAYTEASALRGALLGLAYCFGLGLPFLAMALGASRALRFSSWARRHARSVMRVGGGLLVALGLLLVTGLWDTSIFWLRGWLAAAGLGDFFL
ncbi:cytochrome c biogenesis protein CcdA [Modestobacter muralis]|uniref:Cytochrome c biogenesis protein CcdA n=1 Tax=Modestobacter muralis TaxID=1608614 RepID=A0A6P0ERF7_9ACTN|nr:cytochrome c biogenesis protein CcdA [Modestobacter muralis]NEK93386.1 cytochrome c biogenesis protein CcdA [Modestobacter muralis]NEN50153.1 cytochrome c biogenesis protein CcdA [Modestobacter muralis]